MLRGVLRRIGIAGVLSLALAGTLTAGATPASAVPLGSPVEQVSYWDRYTPIPSDPACAGRTTSFKVTQVSCLYRGANGLMYGYVALDFLSGFNRENVRSCRVYIQLKSSYGSLTDPAAQYDCYTIARLGKSRWFVELDFHKNWGPGRQAGDTYTQYAWVEVATGTPYSGRSVAATKSITL